jgi:prophage regulatory protein
MSLISEIEKVTSATVERMLEQRLSSLREEMREEMYRQLRMIEQREKAPRLLRLPEVCDRTGYKSSKVWAMAAAGTFPQAVKLGPKVSAWREHEVTEWVQQHTV